MAFQKLESRTKGLRHCDFIIGRLVNVQDINLATPRLQSDRFANALTGPGNHNVLQIIHSEAFFLIR
jgi:hypothetical protein